MTRNRRARDRPPLGQGVAAKLAQFFPAGPPIARDGSVYTLVCRTVQFSWDPAKSDATLHQRGFDFEFACQIFGGDIVETADSRRDYREKRMVAIGLADGIQLTVVYTDRILETGVTRRIISARRSNTNERQLYRRQAEPGKDPNSRSRRP